MTNLATLRREILAAWFLLFAAVLNPVMAWQSDNGNGTFNNPVLYADYPDPDIIRVSNDFYMVSTTFADSPGINVLHSKDLVNWELISHCATNLNWSSVYNLTNGDGYRGGFWAGSIRHYNGTFYVLANPMGANARVYYSTSAAGPWQYHQLNQGAYDASLFIETNGAGYIVEGHGPQNVLTLNANFSQVVAVSNNVVNSGGEGSHLVKKGSYYYLFNANPGVWPFQLRCARATNIFGPWETGQICLTATTGGHQGAIVDLDDTGTNWFGFVHQDSGAVGRMTRVGPVFWSNNWPVFGTVGAPNQMATTYPKPVLGQPIMQPGTSDEFTNAALGLQWQWNHNPDNARWSLTERSGYLRLRPTQATNVWLARNTLTQKGQGPQSSGIVKLDLTNLKSNDIAGFGTLGKINGHIYVTADAAGNKTLGMDVDNRGVGSYVAASGVPFSGNTLYLRTDLDFTRNLGICAYSSNGTSWTTLGGQFPLDYDITYSTFQGEKFAISCFNSVTGASAGYVDVDSFTCTNTAPLVTGIRGRAKLNTARTTFVADNGQPLRGPYTSTEWTTGADNGSIVNMKNLGFNAIHLYAESFDPSYPTNGSTAPGYSVANVDRIVAATRTNGLYLVMTIGNGANNGNHNLAWATNFWNFYAPRYANETHVLYEIHNEPLAWGPSYLTGTTPTNTMALEINAYKAIRTNAPNTPVLLFTYAVFGGAGGAAAARTDITNFNQTVFGNPNAVWTNEAVAFHGYGGWGGTAVAVSNTIAAGYPCFMTEFGGVDWGGGGGLDVEMTSELERLGVSWTTFQYVPPSGVSDIVTDPTHYQDLVDDAGLSWPPDYGNWPVARGPFGNGGQPRNTTTNWVSNFLTGTNRIQAEDFDTGGEGVAYHDTSDANQGGQYRPGDGVDIEATADTGGGYDVGWISAGEWLEYSIWVREPGYYDLRLRYAGTAASSVNVVMNARDKTGTWALPSTGGFQTWVTATTNVFLEFGRQKLRLNIVSGAPNLNWIELSPSTNAPIANGIYQLVNRNSGLAMVYDTVNDFVVQTNYTGASVQKWNLQHIGAGQYKISSVFNNDYWNAGGLAGDKVGLVWWWGTDAPWQHFVVRPTGDGFYRIAPANFGIELTVQGGALTNGAPIVSTSNNGYQGLPQEQWGIVATNAPGIPTGLIATYAAATQINLTWNAVVGAASYNIKRSTNSGGPYTTIATGVATTSYSDTPVAAGVKYYYVVSAVVSAAESLNSAEATAPNLWAYLKFDESSGTTAADSTGNGWTGTLINGPTWQSGRYGNAVDLDGSNDYVRLPNGVVNGLSNLTIATWVRLDAVNVWSRVFDFGSGTGTNMFLTPSRGGDGYIYFALKAGGWWEEGIAGTAALPTNVWTHVAVTLSGSTGILYVDGVEVGRKSDMTYTPNGMGNTTSNYVGKSQYNDALLNGRVDELRIYPAALSATEIASLYAYQVPSGTLPQAPIGLVATAVSASQIDLIWNATTNTTSYNIKRSTTNGGPYTVVATGITATNYSNTGLAGSTTYYYVVSASNAVGEGANSTQASATTMAAPANSLTINLQNPGVTVSPLLYGIFFEEINRAGDGGIYAEMLRNRSFEEDTNYPMAWTATLATNSLDWSVPLNTNNATSMKVVAAAGGRVSNCGFVSGGPWWDPAGMQTYYAAQPGQIAVEAGKTYDVTLYARATNTVTLTASLVDSGGGTVAATNFTVTSSAWAKFAVGLTPNQTDPNCRLVISSPAAATFWLDMVSMFPRDTWRGRSNGLRPDLMARIEAMHPAFVRFPGGCFVEGRGVETRVQWKKTIGPVEQRPGHYNIIWGYYSTDGLGYLEYLQMCEDLGTEPLFVINVGMGHSANGEGANGMYAVPLNQMGPFVQDALDAIEYANGSTNTIWGARRAADGHPVPFNLKYMEIGNENWGTDYNDRYALFHDAIKTNYPNIRLIANERTTSRTNDIVDPHFYSNPTAFLNAIDDWDTYSRTDPKIYVGEYAVTEGAGTGNLRAALAEAAYLTGLERNSDVVLMSSYAPLFCRSGWLGWNPNAILFNQSQTYGTPSYWVQTMYAANRGDRILPVTMSIATPPVPAIAGKIGVGTWGGAAKFKDIVVTNTSGVLYQSNFTNGLSNWQLVSGAWSVDTNNNAIVQGDTAVNGALAKVGDVAWTNYTLTLKALKVSGAEGFLITFGSIYDGEKSWWNLGGWGNTSHGVESPGITTPNVAGSIQTNQWYDIRIELLGATAKFYLNGVLIHNVTRTNQNSFTTLAGRDNTTGDTILKFVNVSSESRDVNVKLQGGAGGTQYGRAWVMTAANELDENSYGDPTHIVPVEDLFAMSGTNFTRTFPANSVTVLRVGTNAGPPVVVAGLTATASNLNIALKWNTSSGATSYNVKRSTTLNGVYATIASGITATNYSDAAVNPATTYYYVVSAVRSSGESANCAPTGATTLGPPATPVGLVALATSATEVYLQWSALAGATSYNVKRSTTNGGPYSVVASGVTATNYTDTGLSVDTTYYYVVSAANVGGEGANSAQASATTLMSSANGLIHRYSFSETSGTSIADSIGGAGWAGALPNGGAFSSGRLTLAPGSSQYANLPAGVINGLSNITIMAWVNLNSASTWSRIFDFGNSTTRYMFLTPQIGGTIRFAITTNSNGAEQQINTTSTLSLAAWHQVAVTISSGKGILYLDGVAVGTNNSMTVNPASLGVTTNNYIGKSQWADPYLDGALDEFRIYKTGLSAAEVAATYALGVNQQLSADSPTVTVARSGANLILSWPLAAAGYTLQSRTNLVLGSWVNVPSPVPQIVINQWQVTVPVSVNSSSVFYRLGK